MNKNLKLILICMLTGILGCSVPEKCPDGVNLIPMYGHLPKCNEQITADNLFIKECDSKYPNRKIAAKNVVEEAWEYFNKADYEAAIKRFNQAWLLDTSNADIYWGFGNIMGTKGEYLQSIQLLERSLVLRPDNPKVYESLATSSGQLFFKSKDIKFLNKAIDNLKISIHLDPNRAAVYGQLTAAYSYFNQKDSARKYLALADKLDPTVVNPEVRKILVDK